MEARQPLPIRLINLTLGRVLDRIQRRARRGRQGRPLPTPPQRSAVTITLYG